ncbi:N-acetylneuraminate synthase family protein [Hydrocarboniphaga effusa]|uniref:N-acetylneuraminate synthase family protein n=1 Tax=Hydrocarboniphaga effusa TaxID=243629 RepID=UPI0031381625
MLIDRNLRQYTTRDTASIQEVAQLIAQKKGRIALVVDQNGVLLGTISNGDLIRWLGAGSPRGSQTTALSIANRVFKSVGPDDSRDRIAALLEDVLYVPILDARGRLEAVARHRVAAEGVVLDNRRIARDAPVFTIAEIGNNHNGSLELALRLIDAAADAGADCAKFQMRDMETLYGGASEGRVASENLGTEYVLDLLARYQLSTDDLFRCFDHSRKRGLVPLCTPWDESSMEKLDRYGLPAFKVASADFTNHGFLKSLGSLGKPLICSTGMTTEQEIRQSADLLQRCGAPYVLLHCNSTYPAPFRDVNLSYLRRLEQIGQCTVGYSGHERDIFVSIAAVSLGARVIEKHLTFDRGMEGNDHRISLLPDEFARMVEGIRQVEDAVGSDAPRRISQGEMMNRVTLAKSVFANVDIEAGQVIEESMLEVRSPGRGLQPNRKLELIGKRLTRTVRSGTPFFASDLDGRATRQGAGKRSYRFHRPWGLPVRHHDYAKLLEASAPDFVEFHLSYRDLELEDEHFFSGRQPLNLVVHAPELFAGDHVLDLCSPDEAYRQHSVREMRRVIAKTHSLRRYFETSGPTGIVTNVGGFSLDRPLTPSERQQRRETLKRSLAELDTADVEIWPQTMPPYPWHFGGQRFHNLFVEAEEIDVLCSELKLGLCFDISHSKLACNLLKHSFEDFTTIVGRHTRHLHVADAAGMDGEGLQIGEGEIDFKSFYRRLDQIAPQASFLPEIWQGHENDGEGFWIALDRLQQSVTPPT